MDALTLTAKRRATPREAAPARRPARLRWLSIDAASLSRERQRAGERASGRRSLCVLMRASAFRRPWRSAARERRSSAGRGPRARGGDQSCSARLCHRHEWRARPPPRAAASSEPALVDGARLRADGTYQRSQNVGGVGCGRGKALGCPLPTPSCRGMPCVAGAPRQIRAPGARRRPRRAPQLILEAGVSNCARGSWGRVGLLTRSRWSPEHSSRRPRSRDRRRTTTHTLR